MMSYFSLPKMNSKKLAHLVPVFSAENANITSYKYNSVNIFNLGPSTSLKPNPDLNKTISENQLEKEWEKLIKSFASFYIFGDVLMSKIFQKIPLMGESSWSHFVYFYVENVKEPSTANAATSNSSHVGIFIYPNSFYLPDAQTADIIVSFNDLTVDQMVYVTLSALLLQNGRGIFIMKLNRYFYTPLCMDILYLLACVYNKVFLMPVDNNLYVVCKGFQQTAVRPFFVQMKHILMTLRQNSIKAVQTNGDYNRRIFSTALSSFFVSKVEEYNVLFTHRLFNGMYVS